MNKGRVRDTAFLNYKATLADRILRAKRIGAHTDYAHRLREKTTGELERVLRGMGL